MDSIDLGSILDSHGHHDSVPWPHFALGYQTERHRSLDDRPHLRRGKGKIIEDIGLDHRADPNRITHKMKVCHYRIGFTASLERGPTQISPLPLEFTEKQTHLNTPIDTYLSIQDESTV